MVVHPVQLCGLVQFLELHREFNVEDKMNVLVFADSLKNYLTKFADDAWMDSNGYSVDAGDRE